MKRGSSIERFRLWKVHPKSVVLDDARREQVQRIIADAASYLGIENVDALDVQRSMSFTEAVQQMTEAKGIKAFRTTSPTWRLPMIARDKKHDDAVLLLPHGPNSFEIVRSPRETIAREKIPTRFDEILVLRRTTKPDCQLSDFIKAIGELLPMTSLLVTTGLLAACLLSWVLLTLLLQTEFASQNRTVLVVSSIILAAHVVGVSLLGDMQARSRFSHAYVWLTDQLFRRMLELPARHFARLAHHHGEAMLRAVDSGMYHMFFTRPRLLFAGFFVLSVSIVMLSAGTLFTVFFVAACITVIALLMRGHYAIAKTMRESALYRERFAQELAHYANARIALFGLGLAASSSKRLVKAAANYNDAHERVVVLKRRGALAYMMVPIVLVVTSVLCMHGMFDTWSLYHLSTVVVLQSLAGFALVYLGIKVHVFKNYGFDDDAFARINQLPVTSPAAHVEPVKTVGAIDLLSISFAHEDSGLVVIRDYSLAIPPSHCVVITGPSGSGKTTLLKILCGIHRPHEGEVIYDGQDLRALNPASIKNKFGVIFENTELFAGSIYNNILCGRAIAPKSLEALLLSHEVFDALLDLPMALETYILDNGKNISRLERAAILLARALLHHPAFLFLDEIFGGLSLKDQQIIADYLVSLDITRVVTSLSGTIPLKPDMTINLAASKVA